MHRFILHNDGIYEASAPLLSPGQVGLLSGWGVFSTLRVAGGVLFAFDHHWRRMKRDAAVMRVPFPDDPEYVRSRLNRLVEANHAWDATLRVVVVRNRGGIWQGPGEREFDLIGLTTGLKDWGEGVKLAVHDQARHAGCRFHGVKILSWAENLAMLEEAQSQGFDEVLLLNEHGEVSECTSANVFIAESGRVWTPPLASGCLPGVTRELLLDTVRVDAIPIGEKPLKLEEFYAADEVFITSTTRNLLPVVSIGNRSVGRSSEVRNALETAFEKYVQQYVAEHTRRSET